MIEIPKRGHSGDEEIARVTISMPPALHRRMKRYGDVNWSAVARQAFEKALTELEKTNARS